MSKSTRDTTKIRQKRPPAPGEPITVRLQPDAIGAVDGYIGSQPAPLTRPQAIRAILTEWLASHGFMKRPGHNHSEPTGPATDALRAMDTTVKEHAAAKRRPDKTK